MRPLLTLILLSLALLTIAVGQSSDALFTKRSAVMLHLGLWKEATAGSSRTPNGYISTAVSNGFIGGMSYSYWLAENLATAFCIMLISAEATTVSSTSGATQVASAVVPLHFGVRVTPFSIPTETPFRPYVSVSAGPFLGFEAKNTATAQEARTEVVYGLRLGAGVDILAGRHLLLNVQGGYATMSDYDRPIGARNNFRGPDFSFGIGLLL